MTSIERFEKENNLVSLKKLNKTREESKPYEDNHIIESFRLKSDEIKTLEFSKDKNVRKFVDIEKLICSILGIGRATEYCRTKIYWQELTCIREEGSDSNIFAHWATKKQVRLLFEWGFNPDYFLNGKDWGNQYCKYYIDMSSEWAYLICEAFKMGSFSTNYLELYDQIIHVIEHGFIPVEEWVEEDN